MDMKYDKMVEVTQKESRQKIKLAKETILHMFENKEKISVTALVKETGLSRGFFYKNPEIREVLDDVMNRQKLDPDNYKVTQREKMEKELSDLKNEVAGLKNQNKELMMKIRELEGHNQQLKMGLEKLQQKLARKELSFLKKI